MKPQLHRLYGSTRTRLDTPQADLIGGPEGNPRLREFWDEVIVPAFLFAVAYGAVWVLVVFA